MMLKKLLCAAALLAAGVTLFAQSYEEFKRQALQELAQKDSAWRKEYRDFREKANADYAENMQRAWESVPGSAPVPAPDPEPIVPPVVFPELDIPTIIEDNILAIDEIVLAPDHLPAPMPIAPIVKPEGPAGPQHDFPAFGSTFSVTLDLAGLPKLRSSGESAVSKMWKQLSEKTFDSTLADLLDLRARMDLCDWAYYELVRALAENVYPDDHNASTVFSAFALCQSGFQLRLGRNPLDNALHIIIATDNMVYSHPSWEMNGTTFFLMDDSNVSMLKLYREAFPGEKLMRLAFTNGNHLPVELSDPRERQSERYPSARSVTQINKNLLDFYERYPDSYINNDSRTRWRFYAVDLSEEARQTLYPSLRAAIEGKSELEAANILLNYVQTGFKYEYDEQIWGYDRSFFPDETLYYPYCDCEDRSIFFSRLVRDLMGLKVALVYYPGHLATAIRFNEAVTGDYVQVGDEKYIVSDPTFINAPVGISSQPEEDKSAFVILL